jgi:hypothetical protein
MSSQEKIKAFASGRKLKEMLSFGLGEVVPSRREDIIDIKKYLVTEKDYVGSLAR